jgi:hypothetical protein
MMRGQHSWSRRARKQRMLEILAPQKGAVNSQVCHLDQRTRAIDDAPGVCAGLYKEADCPRRVINFRDDASVAAAHAYWQGHYATSATNLP